MAKFILPDSIVKVPRETVQFPTCTIWPLGTLFRHTPSGLYFRFTPYGGRWDKEYGISTDKGIWVTGDKLELPNPNIKTSIKHPDKNELVKRFLEMLSK